MEISILRVFPLIHDRGSFYLEMSSFKDSTLGVSEGALFQIPSQTFWSPRVICCQNVLSFWRKRFIQWLKNMEERFWASYSLSQVNAGVLLNLLHAAVVFYTTGPCRFWQLYREMSAHIGTLSVFFSDRYWSIQIVDNSVTCLHFLKHLHVLPKQSLYDGTKH